jgi:DNA-binding CsgD family transcriptional regulator
MAGYHQNRDGSLSPREREVLELMAKGLTNGQIAERLDIAFDTAKSHVSAIISKLGVETREEAVRLWREERRVGRRFSRAIRGMVVALGIGKIAAGTAGVAVIGAGVATAEIVPMRPAWPCRRPPGHHRRRRRSRFRSPSRTSAPQVTGRPRPFRMARSTHWGRSR